MSSGVQNLKDINCNSSHKDNVLKIITEAIR